MIKLGSTGQLAVLIAAAALEVGGDALIRKGMRGGGLALIVLGFVVLGSYGVVVNVLELDFSRPGSAWGWCSRAARSFTSARAE